MLPVTTGFIFPNGEIINTSGKGHCKCANKYIVDHNLQKEFELYEGQPDDFLIDRLGVAKVCHYCGKHYIYLPKIVGIFLNEMRKLYKKHGYVVKYYFRNSTREFNYKIFNNKLYSYNQTVIKDFDSNGNIVYKYNPLRIGD